MLANVRVILSSRGAIDTVAQKQLRLINRDDLLEIITANGGSTEHLHFDGLDFTGADLRGLQLHTTYFMGCDFTRVMAFPLIKISGEELTPNDLATNWTLEKWTKGQIEADQEVIPTNFEQSFFTGAKLDDAQFASANMRNAFFVRTVANGTIFFKADLSASVFNFARFTDVDLRSADFRDVKLYAMRLDTQLLDDVNWGDGFVVSHEKEAKWDEAVPVYRALSRVHDLAAMHDIAGEFRFRHESARISHLLQQLLAFSQANSDAAGPRRWLSAVRHGGAPTFSSWLLRQFVNQIFGYGERPWRVIRATLTILLLSSLIYFEYSTVELSSGGGAEFLRRAGQAVYFSAVSSTALGYGPWVELDIGVRQYFGAVQAFVGTFLLALFLVTFTRRWMR